MSLYLRRATMDDMDLLFKWANNPDVRKNSFNTEPIPYENHVEWFNKMMLNNSVIQYILCENDIELGQIRLNIENKTAVIDYSIDEVFRGKGLGTKMLTMIEEIIVSEKIPVFTLIGQVKYENKASAKAFIKNEYIQLNQDKYLEYNKKIGVI